MEFGGTAALGNSTTPVPCGNGCTITVPSAAGKPFFYRWRYLDSQGNAVLLGTISTEVAK